MILAHKWYVKVEDSRDEDYYGPSGGNRSGITTIGSGLRHPLSTSVGGRVLSPFGWVSVAHGLKAVRVKQSFLVKLPSRWRLRTRNGSSPRSWKTTFITVKKRWTIGRRIRVR